MAEYEVARINLACATGTLLGYDRIRLEPIRMGTPDLSP
jgi:hypothetical protein